MTSPRSAVRPSAHDRILATAIELFNTHGVRGVGVDRIIAESGVAKATLYAHFGCKEALVTAYLRASDEWWRAELRRAATEAGDDPREQLVGLFDALRDAAERDSFRGCAFVNSAREVEPGTDPHAMTVQHKQAVRSWLTGLATAAGAADPQRLALQLSILADGAMAVAALESRAEFMTAARDAARVLVERECPARR